MLGVNDINQLLLSLGRLYVFLIFKFSDKLKDFMLLYGLQGLIKPLQNPFDCWKMPPSSNQKKRRHSGDTRSLDGNEGFVSQLTVTWVQTVRGIFIPYPKHFNWTFCCIWDITTSADEAVTLTSEPLCISECRVLEGSSHSSQWRVPTQPSLSAALRDHGLKYSTSSFN